MLGLNLANSGQAALEYMQRSARLSENLPLAIAFGGIALFWIVLYFWDRFQRRKQRKPSSRPSLFLELCQAHNLNSTEQHLLTQLAKHDHLANRELLFVDPKPFTRMVSQRSSDSAAFVELQHKLFGD